MTSSRRRLPSAVWLLLLLLSVAVVPGAVHAWGRRAIGSWRSWPRTISPRQRGRTSCGCLATPAWPTSPSGPISNWKGTTRRRSGTTSTFRPDAAGYDRDRDCPRQPGVGRGSRNDRWRDCVVDRIEYNEERLANRALDRADRAVALKFLVHFVGDVHQPFHALGVARGGNDIPVSVFGSSNCAYDGGQPYPCNLHGVWDTDARRPSPVERSAVSRRPGKTDQNIAAWTPTPTARLRNGRWSRMRWRKRRWCHAAASSTTRTTGAQIQAIDERLALGGVRLAASLNRSLTGVPPSR